jgi:hypothetical protein
MVGRTVVEPDDRLAREPQLAGAERPAQPLRRRAGRAWGAKHARVEHRDGRYGATGRGERGVGVPEQRAGGPVQPVGERRDPRGDGDAGRAAGDADQRAGQLARLRRAGLGQQDRELAAADAREQVGRAQPSAQRARDRAASRVVRALGRHHDHRAGAVVPARERRLPAERDRERPRGRQASQLVRDTGHRTINGVRAGS